MPFVGHVMSKHVLKDTSPVVRESFGSVSSRNSYSSLAGAKRWRVRSTYDLKDVGCHYHIPNIKPYIFIMFEIFPENLTSTYCVLGDLGTDIRLLSLYLSSQCNLPSVCRTNPKVRWLMLWCKLRQSLSHVR